jgi:hypothetical protein
MTNTGWGVKPAPIHYPAVVLFSRKLTGKVKKGGICLAGLFNGTPFPLGSRQQRIPQYCAGFGLVYKAHTAAQIEIRVGGCNTVDEATDKKDRELFFTGALSLSR